MNHPINNIKWIKPSQLNANDYNPNVVLNQELKLLKLSLLKQGWLQPILIDQDNVIIDGYHRYWLAANDKEVAALADNTVPCAILDLSLSERMLLTIRINRAKGNHVALKMHEIVYALHNDHGVAKEHIAESIGANEQEINLLLQENVFSSKDTKNHKYSKAWIPAKRIEKQ